MYILTLEAENNSMNYVYARDMKSLMKALPYAIRKGVVLYADPLMDHVQQTQILKQDYRADTEQAFLKVLQQKLIGGQVTLHPDASIVPSMMTKDHYYMCPESSQLVPFKRAISNYKRAACNQG